MGLGEVFSWILYVQNYRKVEMSRVVYFGILGFWFFLNWNFYFEFIEIIEENQGKGNLDNVWSFEL